MALPPHAHAVDAPGLLDARLANIAISIERARIAATATGLVHRSVIVAVAWIHSPDTYAVQLAILLDAAAPDVAIGVE